MQLVLIYFERTFFFQPSSLAQTDYPFPTLLIYLTFSSSPPPPAAATNPFRLTCRLRVSSFTYHVKSFQRIEVKQPHHQVYFYKDKTNNNINLMKSYFIFVLPSSDSAQSLQAIIVLLKPLLRTRLNCSFQTCPLVSFIPEMAMHVVFF